MLATGLGKTWLSAFDSADFRRVLFVAHREEILQQAMATFRRVRPNARFGLFTGEKKDLEADILFASIQTLGKARHLRNFPPDSFDYVVVDEFHHASAPSYRKVLSHFRPKFMLGLTATPDRSDAADLLALCDDNLVYECNLLEGVNRQLLSPFKYRAIRDVADYEHIPWRSGRFDIDELAQRLETEERSQQVYDEWLKANGPTSRALGFCCSISHANHMAAFFTARGVKAVAVTTPNVVELMAVPGVENVGVLVMLNVSARNCVEKRSPMWNVFMRLVSKFQKPGPRITPRPALPGLTVPCATAVKQEVFHHCASV